MHKNKHFMHSVNFHHTIKLIILLHNKNSYKKYISKILTSAEITWKCSAKYILFKCE